MPAIIRLRTSAETTSAMSSKSRPVRSRNVPHLLRLRPGAGFFCNRGFDVRLHRLGHKLHHRNDHRVSELLVRLGIGNSDPEFSLFGLESHQAGAFDRRKPPWSLARLRHQNFRAVFVIACRQGPGNVVRSEQAEAETIARSIVLRLVVLEIFPEMRSERVLRVYLVRGLEDAAKLWPLPFRRDLQRSEIKVSGITEPHDEYPFALLRYPRFRTDHPMLHMIAEFIFEHVDDGGERAALVMSFKILNVFQDESRRPVMSYDLCGVEKKRALGVAQKPVWSAESVFLGNTGDGKWLARKSGHEQIVCRNLFRIG